MAHEVKHADGRTMARVFRAAMQILDDHDVPYIVIGSIAAEVHGEESWPRPGSDVDIFMSEEDAHRGQKLLGENGFHIEEADEDWLLKAYRDGVLVDLIYRAAGTISIDEEMLGRSRTGEVEGRVVRLIAPEDYIVIQSLTFSRETPDHWFNAVGVLTRSRIDWEYLLRRAEAHEPRKRARTLALLLFAHASGCRVPDDVLQRLSADVLA